jgi:hypothetical protein
MATSAAPFSPRRAALAFAFAFVLAAAALAAPRASAAYSPFSQLTADFLDGTSDPTAKYGPEDKLLAVNGLLVFVDIDQTPARVLSYDPAAAAWSSTPVVEVACVPADARHLVPRDNGYTVGVTSNPLGTDRLVIVGGDLDNNVWFSDDSGVTWQCSAPPQTWMGRAFAPLWHSPGVLPGDPLVMVGGLVNETITSIGMFISYDSGMHWQRPFCALQSACSAAFPPTPGFPVKDPDNPFASIDNICVLANECYMLPEANVYPGALASDWNTLWMWSEISGNLYYLNQSSFGSGWVTAAGASVAGAGGRKTFIRGTAPGSGCWFSTDFTALDLYVNPALRSVSSTNLFATAKSALGPWTVSPVPAPWAARGSAAVTSSPAASFAWVAGGVSIANGVINPDPSSTFGDAWQIDAGVCLLASDGSVCSGHGSPDLGSVTCVCDAGFGGDLCDQCLDGASYGVYPQCGACAVVPGKGACNEFAGGGLCDPTVGCICRAGWGTPDSGCDSCADGYYGPRCAACAACGANGACDGSGTSTGTGRCVCAAGYTGDDCSTATVPAADAAASAAAAAAAAAAAPNAVAWVSSLALAGIALSWLLQTYAPSTYARARAALGLAGGSGGGSGGYDARSESVPLKISVSPVGGAGSSRLSAESAKARFAGGS